MSSDIRRLMEEINQSRLMTKQNLDEFLEEDEDYVEENVTSNIDGGEGQPRTPYAFRKDEKDPKAKSYGWESKVPKTNLYFQKIQDIYNRLASDKLLNELSYNDFRNDDSLSERQKINTNILEIGKKLREVEQMVNHASKLKLESGADNTIFWKGTISKFTKINERLLRLSSKIKEIAA